MTPRIPAPTLPFALDALEPHLSRASVENHFNNHHRRYVDRVNALVLGTPLESLTIEGIMECTAKRKSTAELFNNAAQAFNHAFFWSSIKPAGGGRPTGLIAHHIANDFGGYDAFAVKFRKSAQELFGSGWIWLVLDKGKVKIMTTKDAQTPGLKGKTSLVTLDLWEHSYYPDYGPRRAAYVDAFLNGFVNWDFANANIARTKLSQVADRFAVVSTPPKPPHQRRRLPNSKIGEIGMNQIAISKYARQLYDEYGSRAMVIAGQRRRILEEAGEFEKAALWSCIRQSVQQMRCASAA